MSWDWKSEREQKEYEKKGEVTISTDEYRDLIWEVADLREKGQKEHDDWYKEYRKCQDLEKQLTACSERLTEIETWMAESDLYKSFKAWKVDKMEEDEE